MIINVPLSNIQPNPFQPMTRLGMPDSEAAELGRSILEHGLLYPPKARQAAAAPVNGYSVYEIGDGWRRFTAFRWLVSHSHPELNQMPLDVSDISDQQMADMIIEANTTGKGLCAIDKAWFYKNCQFKFKITQEEVAKRYNVSQGEVANSIRLLELPAETQNAIILRKITETHALKLVALKDWPGLLQPLVAEVIATGMSTAVLEEKVRNILGKQKKVKPVTPPAPPLEIVKTPPPSAVLPSLDERVVSDVKDALAKGANPNSQTLEREPDEKAEELPLLKKEDKELPPVHGANPVKPVTAPAPAPIPKPITPAAALKWKRKMSLEELGGEVRLTLASDKGLVIKRLTGNLEDALEQLPAILTEATSQWLEKESK